MSKILEKAVTESISPGLMAHLYTTAVVCAAAAAARKIKTGIAVVQKQGR